MNTKKLKQLVLDLAIHGKLVPQDPNDEPASELLKRIQADVETHGRASNKSKGKKSAVSSVDLDEVPFEVPSSWCWTTIGELLTNRDSERKPVSSTERKKQSERIYDYYGATGVVDKVASYLFDERLLLIGEDGANLLSRAKDNAFFAEGKYWVNNHAHILDCKEKSILDYVAVVVNSMSLDDYITGSAQPKLSQDNLNKILIPLPPLAEQHRIVAAIEKWFAVIDQLEKNEADLKKSIEQTKKKVLDLAIRGKLVAQDGEWEEKPLSEVCSYIGDGDWIEKKDQSSEGIRLIQTGNIGDGCFKDKNDSYHFISKQTFEELNCTEIYEGDILISRLPEPLGRSCIVPKLPHRLITAVDCTILRTNELILPQYFCYYTQTTRYHRSIKEFEAGTTRKRISRTNLEKILIPLPSLSEQKRIVAKVEELFGVLERIGGV